MIATKPRLSFFERYLTLWVAAATRTTAVGFRHRRG
jgi:hypothetical protein